MSMPAVVRDRRIDAGLPLATWHAGTGDRAVIQPHFRGRSVAFASFRCDPGDVRWTLENQVGRGAAHHLPGHALAARRRRAGVEPLEAEERLLALAAETIGAAFGGFPRVSRDAPRFVESAKALLATDVAARLTLPEVGRALNVSEFHLARTFRAHTGYSLHGYRLHLRLRMAADLVCDDDAELREVAARVGFSSHSHLTSAFRKVFGVPPSVIRKRAWLSRSCAVSPPGCQKPAGLE
jgi:AraC-like DNA-binding protein